LRNAGPSLSQITLTTFHSKSQITVAEGNDGANIAHVETGRLFDGFVQGTESQGAGLGLTIVQEAVSCQNGCVTLTIVQRAHFEVSNGWQQGLRHHKHHAEPKRGLSSSGQPMYLG
jgi:signal transduction histidine kinase